MNTRRFPLFMVLSVIVLLLAGLSAWQFYRLNFGQNTIERQRQTSLHAAIIRYLDRVAANVHTNDPHSVTARLNPQMTVKRAVRGIKDSIPSRYYAAGRVSFQTRKDKTGERIEILLDRRLLLQVRFQQTASPSDKTTTPILMIVLDDAGMPSPLSYDFLTCEVPLTFAVMPGLPDTEKFARQASAKNFCVILHQPMEAPKKTMDDTFIRVGDTPDNIAAKLEKHFQEIGFAVGMNNHMGSSATRHPATMKSVMAYLKQKGFFYIDSLTTPNSVAYETARQMGVPTVKRNVFIDHQPGEEEAAKQLRRALELANRHGQALAIGHVTKAATYRALKTFIRDHRDGEIRFMRVDTYLRGNDDHSRHRNQL